ncbi:hypothetical protein [Pedobacter frigidisoli]|uniref:hypothetical protein n=1 Tax=Pedobacter frigidisoli TaxID=2530455 RepID=UPI0013F17D99|nr:hypothetical protein [Pedobacter frigidisoli]
MNEYKIKDPSLATLLLVMNFEDHLILSEAQAREYGIENADQLPLTEEEYDGY